MPTEIYKGFTLNQVGQPIWGAQENTNFKQLIDLLLNASGAVKYIAKDGSTVTTGTIQFNKAIEVTGTSVGNNGIVIPNDTIISAKGNSINIGEGTGGFISLSALGGYFCSSDGQAFLSMLREQAVLTARTSVVIKASDNVSNWTGGAVNLTQLAANITVSGNNQNNNTLGQILLNQSSMSLMHDGGIHINSDIRFSNNGTPGANKIPIGTDNFGNWTWQPISDIASNKLDKIQSDAQSVISTVEWYGTQRFRSGFESYNGSSKTADLSSDGRFRCTGPLELYANAVGSDFNRLVLDGVGGFGVIGNREVSGDLFHTRIDFRDENIVIVDSLVNPMSGAFKIDVETVIIPSLNTVAPTVGDVLGAADINGTLRWQSSNAMNNVVDTNTVDLSMVSNTLSADVKIASDVVVPGQILRTAGSNGLYVTSDEVLSVVNEDGYHTGFKFVGATGLGTDILPLIQGSSENCAALIEILAVFTSSPTTQVGSAIVSYNAFNSSAAGGSYVLSRTYDVVGNGFGGWDFIHGTAGGGDTQFGIRTNDSLNRGYDVYIKVVTASEKLQFANAPSILGPSVLQVGASASSVKQTATIQMSKPGSVTANSVISPPTDGASWFSGNAQGYYTGTLKAYKLTNVNCNLLRYVTYGAGSISMRLSYITGLQTTVYNAGNGTPIATWTASIPDTAGADWFYHGFVNAVNVNIPLGATIFLEVSNRTAVSIDGLAALLNFEEV